MPKDRIFPRFLELFGYFYAKIAADNRMQIDVEEVLREKAPGLARWTPGFAVAYLRRIVHQDEVNRILALYGHLTGVEFIRACLADLGITYTAVGIERLDSAGRYLFASNHPFGGVDGLMLAEQVSEYFGDVRVVVNDILMNIPPLAPIFVPVNKHGRQNPAYAGLYNSAFESDLPIITFPAGLCSRRRRGRVADLRWKPSFVKKAVASGRDVVPVFCEGRLSNFFYRLSSLRTRLGIGANVEMLYLVDELFRQRGRHFDIHIGRPIPCTDLSDGRSAGEWTAEIRRRAYALDPAGEKTL